MVYYTTSEEDEASPSTSGLSSSLSPLPSLESSSSCEYTEKDEAGDDNVSSLASSQQDSLSPDDKSELNDGKDGGVNAATAFRLSSIFCGYSFIGRLTVVLISILSCYYQRSYSSTTNEHTPSQLLQCKKERYSFAAAKVNSQPLHKYEEGGETVDEREPQEVVEEEDHWETWGHGFDHTKHRDFWISDEDLTEELAADLNSTDHSIRQEAMSRRQLDPAAWETFDYWEIYHYFGCVKIMSSTRPVWSEQLFRDTRDFYHDFVENDDTPFVGIFRSTHQANEDVYDVSQNVIPNQSDNKGRGLKAARDIKQGEMIFKATNNTIIFNHGHTYRKFLFALNERFSDPGMVCDIMIWAWVQDMEGETLFAGVVDLDNGNLLNDSALGPECLDNHEDEEYESRCIATQNIQCSGPALTCIASRDIPEGEELLGDYLDFLSQYSWRSLGL